MFRVPSIIKPDITLIYISRVWPIIKADITWEASVLGLAYFPGKSVLDYYMGIIMPYMGNHYTDLITYY